MEIEYKNDRQLKAVMSEFERLCAVKLSPGQQLLLAAKIVWVLAVAYFRRRTEHEKLIIDFDDVSVRLDQW